MLLSFTMLRRLFERPPAPEQAEAPAPPAEQPAAADKSAVRAPASPPAEPRPARPTTEVRQTSSGELQSERPGEDDEGFVGPRFARGGRSAHLAGLMGAYLGARAEEALELLFEAVSRGTADEVARAMREAREALSEQIAGVQESATATQRETSRLGRELMRAGATLEGVQVSLADVGTTLQRLESSLEAGRGSLQEREREIREEILAETLGDSLATLDGLEAALDEARSLVRALAEVERQIEDPTVRRWWRAMGEAIGTKRPLPAVPVADLEAWLRGLEITYRRLKDSLERRGIVAIEAAGRPFDPHLHEAVAVAPCPPEQDGIVLREEQRGYRSADRVVRLAQVVVGKAPAPNEVNGEPPAEKPRRPRRQAAPGAQGGEERTEEGANE